MTYVELIPSLRLRPYIQLIWCMESEAIALQSPERIAPDGIVELVLHYGEPIAVRFAGETFTRQPQSSAVSQTRRFVDIRSTGPIGLISVRFRPWGAYHFIRTPVSAFRDQVVSADALWDASRIRKLEEELAAATTVYQRVALVETFLLEELARNHKADVEPLVRAVWNRKGRIGVPELCRTLGITERKAQRCFAAAMGTSPKGFARIARFLHACDVLLSGDWRSLTEVGHDCGYYDQAHFIADFKNYSGLTPGEFLRAPRFSFLRLE